MIQAADNINSREMNTFITKSFSYMVEGSLTNIQQYLETFTHANYHHPLARIIKAIIEFSKGQVKESLQILK